MSDTEKQHPTTESMSEGLYKTEQLARIDTLVSDMHHRLFGNGQPGIIAEYNTRIVKLEGERNKVLGVMEFVKYVAILTPVIVAVTEGYRIWLQLHP